MVGIDLSLSPAMWAAPHGRGLAHGVLDPAGPGALGEALRTAGIRDRNVALAVRADPPRDVWTGLLPKAFAGARARRSAVLAAAQQLKLNPAAVVASLDRVPDGIAYVAGPRDVVARWAAPWQAAPWRLVVVEPAAAALLRAAAGDKIELFVRTGTTALGLVVGSRTRWVLARTVELDWAADLGRARVEVGDTLEMAHKAGADPVGLVIGGAGPAGLLVDAVAGLGPTRPLLLSEPLEPPDIPPEAVVAVAMARWASIPRVPRQERRGELAARLSRLLRRRSPNAA
jgi:hypothetical protein